jgi:hypothetical protein
MRTGLWCVVLLAIAASAAGCKKDRSRSAARRDGGPVVVIEQPGQVGSVGPLVPEAEPNDERDRAAAVAVPGGVQGTLARADDIDFYRIDAGPARVLSVRLGGAAADQGGADLVLEMFDADGKPVARSDRGPAGALEGLPDAPLAKGAIVYLAVSQVAKKAGRKKPKKPAAAGAEAPAEGAAAAGPAYQLTVEPVTPGNEDEREPNDKPDGAGEVLLSEQRAGYLGWSKDQDLWKLNLTGFSGGFGLDIAVDGVEGAALAVDILAPDGRVLLARKGQKDRSLLVRGVLPELGSPFYLARISGSRSNPEVAYRLRPTARALAEGEEAEPDDDPEHAIAAGTLGEGATGERRGYLDGGDTDLYKFEVGRESVGFTVSVEPPGPTDVVLRVLGPSGAEVARADAGRAGQREEIAALPLGRGEVRFVAVSGAALGDEPDPYLLRWNAAVNLAPAPGTPPPAGEEEPPEEDPYGR